MKLALILPAFIGMLDFENSASGQIPGAGLEPEIELLGQEGQAT
jgi:hypothetical protein